MHQRTLFLKSIGLNKKTIVILGLFILAVFLISQQQLLKSINPSNSDNIALASPGCISANCAVYGTICCPGVESCIKWWEDENHCGGSCKTCASGAECRLNTPGDYGSGANCFCRSDWCNTYGLICCFGTEGCVNPWTDANNCQTCGHRCGTGYKCTNAQCVDGTAPSVSITKPTNGSTVSGTVEIAANVSDPQSPIEWVKFSVKKRYTTTTTEICTDTSFPYACPWDTTKFADASYYVYASAKSAGGTGQRNITVTVKNGSCTCTPWAGQGCDGTGCASTELRFTRTCIPSGCGTATKCVADVTCGACTDQCVSGQKRCDLTNNTRYQTCGQYDSDPCLDWSSSIACAAGQTCSGSGVCGGGCNPDACAAFGTICCPGITDCIKWWENENNCGSCGVKCSIGKECRLNVPGDYTKGASCQSCTNECPSLGTKECTDSTHYKTCGNYDLADPCLEWSTATTACPYGQTCSGDSCSSEPKPGSFVIQPIVLFPSDSSVDPIIPAVVKQNMAAIASWYGQQLGGKTFTLSSVTTLKGTHPSGWFSDCYNEATRFTCSQIVWKQLEEMGYNNKETGKIKAVFYIAARVGVVGGTSDFPCTAYSSDCKFGFFAAGSAWVWAYETTNVQNVNKLRGAVAHELGHTFALPHPYCCPNNCPSELRCEATLMYWGYILYPNTYFLDKIYPDVGHGCCPEKSTLRENDFFK